MNEELIEELMENEDPFIAKTTKEKLKNNLVKIEKLSNQEGLINHGKSAKARFVNENVKSISKKNN